VETVVIDTPQCPQCGQALKDFPGTEDSEVLEIEVQVRISEERDRPFRHRDRRIRERDRSFR